MTKLLKSKLFFFTAWVSLFLIATSYTLIQFYLPRLPKRDALDELIATGLVKEVSFAYEGEFIEWASKYVYIPKVPDNLTVLLPHDDVDKVINLLCVLELKFLKVNVTSSQGDVIKNFLSSEIPVWSLSLNSESPGCFLELQDIAINIHPDAVIHFRGFCINSYLISSSVRELTFNDCRFLNNCNIAQLVPGNLVFKYTHADTVHVTGNISESAIYYCRFKKLSIYNGDLKRLQFCGEPPDLTVLSRFGNVKITFRETASGKEYDFHGNKSWPKEIQEFRVQSPF